MWIRELESIYSENLLTEEWRGLSIDTTPSIKGVSAPVLDRVNSIKNLKIGTEEPNLAQISAASGNNPYEQEEEPVLKHINTIISTLDPSSQQHLHTITTLEGLKKFINKKK